MSTLRHQLLASSLLLSLVTTVSGKPANARLVKDLDRRATPSDIPWIESASNGAVFSMNSRKYGSELWVSNEKGTRLLKDIYPGSWGSNPTPIMARGGIIYLTCVDQEHGRRIWRTDGTPEGTRLHSDLMPGLASSESGLLLEDNGKLYLFGLSPDGFGLFTVDDNGPVSQVLMEVPVDPDASEHPTSPFSPGRSFTLGDRAYFLDQGGHLWESDGTPEGTGKIVNFTLPEGKLPGHVVVFSGKAIIRVADDASGAGEFWTWSPGGTGPELLMSSSLNPQAVVLGDKLMVVDSSSLRISDGTPEGTAILKSFPEGSLVKHLGMKGDDAFLEVVKEDSFDIELWKTDGTEQGTQLVKEFGGLTEPGTLAGFTVMEDRACFTIRPERFTSESGSSLWITDGTAEGTAEVKPGARFGTRDMAAFGSRLYFSSFDQLWITKGTPKTTKPLVKASGNPRSFFEHGETGGILATDRRLFLFSSSYEDEPEGIVAVSGGTAASTRPFWSRQNSEVHAGAVLGTKVLFEDAAGIYITNGTARGTRSLFQYRGGEESPGFSDTLTIGNTCYMVGSKPGGGGSLWKTDGTPAGTLQIQGAGEPLSSHTLTELHGTAYYLSTNKELWATDGSAAGPRMIKGGFTGSGPYQLIHSGDRLYFFTEDSEAGMENGEALRTIWTSDGTAAGTTVAGTIRGRFGMPAGLDGDLVFALSADNGPWELHRANETGITKYATLPEGFQIEEGASTDNRSLAVAGGNLFFKCGKPWDIIANPDYRAWGELWKTDGTPGGTMIVKDLVEGDDGSAPRELTPAGDHIYFVASNPGKGTKIWKSDGTEEGTVMIQSEESTTIFLSDLTPFKSKLYFTALDPRVGIELHSLALPKAKKKKK